MPRLFPTLAVAFALSSPLLAQVPQLWGLTTTGGDHDGGTIFRVNGDGSGYATVFSFDSLSGGSPEGGLCVAQGKLYGMTNRWGADQVGTLFSYDPGGAGFHKILDFDMVNGGLPWGSMIRGADGMLYGTSYMGGGPGGSIFRLDPATEDFTILHGFDETNEGGAVTDRLFQAADGALYGLCPYGGANNHGTVFRFELSTSTFTKLHDFDGTNGSTPYGSLCQGPDGLLYGMTYEGGTTAQGTLFSIDPTDGTFVKRIDFTGANGSDPWGSLVRASDGTLYGTTTLGGPSSGQIFSFEPSTNVLTTLHSFVGMDGGLLFGSVIIGSDGALYGTGATSSTGLGLAYRFVPGTGTLTSLHDFALSEGNSPRGELVEYGSVQGIDEHAEGPSFSLFPNPTEGAITVLLHDRANATLTLTDLSGREVLHTTVTAERTTLQLDQPTGVYLLSLTTAQGRSVQRITVQ